MARFETSPYLHPEALQRYTSSVKPRDRRIYEVSLWKTKRWRKDEKIAGLIEGLRDNNHLHVHKLIEMDFDYEHNNPHLANEVDFGKIQGMHLSHDGAEWKIGDWPAVDEVRDSTEAQEAKAEEPLVIREMIDTYVRRRKNKRYWKNLYRRYAEKNPYYDKESLLANFIDKAEASTGKGAEHVFNPTVQGDRLTHELRLRNMKGIRKMMQYVPPLLKLLSPEAQAEMRQIVGAELQKIIENGFEQEIRAMLAEMHLENVLQ